MLHHLRRSGKQLLSPDAWKTRLVFWLGAGLVGLVATGFALAAEQANHLFRFVAAQAAWMPFVVTPLGLILVSWLTVRFFPGTQGSGIPQAIAALDLRDHGARRRLLSLRIAAGKIGLTLLGLLSGATIGREGPTVHIGAAIMFSLGRFAKFPFHYMDRGLILAGGAAGIAAAFNTPLAGVLFAIEEMSRTFEERTSGTLLTAVVLAGITAVAIQGNYSYFGRASAELPPGEVIVPILVCGTVGGLLGGLFSTALIWGSARLRGFALRHPLLLAGLCGLALAAVGTASGGLTYGTGYAEATAVVTGAGTVPHSYPLYKMLATVVSYLSGIPGGIFAPSLATGAGVGAHLAELMPGYPAAALIILGMVGYFAGVVQTPITAFVIVMEMTDNTSLILPLMATAFVAYATSRLVCPRPIYRVLAEAFIPAGARTASPAGQSGPGTRP